MIPVLPAFAGHVPAALTKLYPNATFSQLSPWSHFNCTYSCSYLLDPNDPLFRKIGKLFIEEQMKEYNGTNHIYNSDVFNEMTPKSSDPKYLASTSRAVYDAMVAADPQAYWLMQGWLFYHASWFWKDEQMKAMLTAVPQGRMIVLDLFAESYPQYNVTRSFYGQPFIWCMLHNFGGNLGFYGKIHRIIKDPIEAFHSNNSTMIGSGITPEGINQNYLVYELMLEVGYSLESADVDKWIKRFVQRRYGVNNPHATRAWLTFASTVLNDEENGKPSSKVLIRGPIVKRPTTSMVGMPEWYDVTSQLQAWDDFMKALQSLPDVETVRYDAVDVTRQLLQDVHRLLYYNILQAFLKDRTYSEGQVRHYAAMMSALFDDMDRILSCDRHFMMGTWIESARLAATSQEERDIFEMNARMQVTLWGPNGEILDYADKHWSSLMRYYYKPRWELFNKFLIDAHDNDDKKFDHKKFQREVFNKVERPFVDDRTNFPTTPKENAIEVAKEIYQKWRFYFPTGRQMNNLSGMLRKKLREL